MMRKLHRSVFLAAVALLAITAKADEIRPFDARSPNAIRAAHSGRPFVLALWSVTCAPCREEMGTWKEFQRKYPGIALVLVATDPPEDKTAVSKFLASYGPGQVENWAFADDFSEPIRYAVDRSWRGELPRTYFFDAAHHATAYSGRVEIGRIEAWLSQQGLTSSKVAVKQ